MNFDDSPELAAFRAEARAWLEPNVAAFEREHGRRPGDVDDLEAQRAWQRTLFEGGWGAPAWPEQFGGRGLDMVSAIVWGQEKARAGAGTWFNLVAYGMAGPTIVDCGTDAHRQRYLPPMLSGDEIWCQLFSEPGAGSDLARVATRAERDGDTWVVNGQKVWSSLAHTADHGILLARHDPDLPKHHGLVYLLCDMHADGVEVRPLRQIDGRADFNEVFLTDVRIPDTERVGEPGDGWRIARTTLLHERMSLGGGLGDFAFGFDRLARMARGGSASVRRALVDVYAQHRFVDLLNARIVSKLTRGQIPDAEGSILKMAMSQLTTSSALLATQLAGSASLLADDDGPVRAYLSEPAIHIGGGTDEVQRNAISERVLGLPREPATDRDVAFRDLP